MFDCPAISVLLPVFNAEQYLQRAIESVLAQTFGDFELIAIDDGSTDRSLAILQKLARKDARIRLISRPNTGIAGALNDGIATARAELLARIDADDLAVPARFEKQVQYLSEHPECVLLGSRVLLIDPYGTPLYESSHRTEHAEILAELLSGSGWAVVHPAAMMRTRAVRAAGGYRTERVPIEDLDLFLRLTETGEAANLPDVLTHYRQHPRSENRTRFDEQESKKRACVADAYVRRGLQLPANWSPPPRVHLTVAEEVRQWGWAALKAQRVQVARKHAVATLKLEPFSSSSWRLVYCAVRGR